MKNNTAIVLLILSVGLFYTFTNVQYKEVKALNTVASDYKNVLENVSHIVELRDGLLVTYNAFPKTEIERIDKVLPDHIDTVRLALDLDGIASRYGISMKSIQVVTGTDRSRSSVVLPDNTSSFEKATVSFGFVSKYDDFMSFISDIEKSLRIMDIKSITFQTSENGLYDFQVSVDTYWLK